jgi:outer membrane usher protein
MFATRPVRQGYALIEVPGAAGVRGFLDNQEIGRTNDRGELFVPDVLPYYDHKFSIELTDLPLTTSTSSTQRHVTPGQRSGTIARFDLRKMRSVAGTLYIEEGPTAHRVHYGDFIVVLETRELMSPVDDAGRFYLEDLPAGRYPARIVEGTVTCTFRLDVPDVGEAVIEMGEVRCQRPYLAIAKAETAP